MNHKSWWRSSLVGIFGVVIASVIVLFVACTGLNEQSELDLGTTATTTAVAPTLTPSSTPLPATATPTPTATRTVTPTPTPTPPVEMETYTDQSSGFSIQYPVGWTVTEEQDGVTFSKPGAVMTLFVQLFPRARPPVTARAMSDAFVEGMRERCPGLEISRSYTILAGGVEWLETDLTCTENDLPLAYALFVTVKERTGYLIMSLSPVDDFSQWQDAFNFMVYSFQFSAPPTVSATPTATPTPSKETPLPTKIPTGTPVPITTPYHLWPHLHRPPETSAQLWI